MRMLATSLLATIAAAGALPLAATPAVAETSGVFIGPTAAMARPALELSRQRTGAAERARRSATTSLARVAAPRPKTSPTATTSTQVTAVPVGVASPAQPVLATATPAPAPVAQAAAAATAPSTTARGSFPKRACTRSYPLSGMQVGTAGDAGANGDRLRTVLRAARPGDCITVAPGHYRLAGSVEFGVPDVTFAGLGSNREGVWFEHTTELQATFMVTAGGVHLSNFTHRVHGTARSSRGQMGEGNIWVQGGHSGFQMEDVLAWGSRDAAIFLYGVHHFALNRVESRDSRSDAFHISNGSSYGEWYDCTSRSSGDDGLGFVGYGAEGAGTPHHHTVVRHHVAGQSWGRGIGLIHVNNISIYGPTLIEDTAGAGLILARESQYGSGSVRAIRVYGELRFRRANGHADIAHGAIHINNPNTGGAIEDVRISGPVVAVDTGLNRPGGVPSQVRVQGVGRISAEIANMSFYGSGPAVPLHTALAVGSSLTTPGWSNATPRLAVEPVFPLR